VHERESNPYNKKTIPVAKTYDINLIFYFHQCLFEVIVEYPKKHNTEKIKKETDYVPKLIIHFAFNPLMPRSEWELKINSHTVGTGKNCRWPKARRSS
jgi:hypothetical protein